jgi:acyl-CoA synthetase (AMP-forming)/AMP-acid ligase II
MNINLILEMALAAGDRVAVAAPSGSLTVAELDAHARRAATRFRGADAVLYLAANHLAYPVALFGAALAGVPFVPLNYRLGGEQLSRLVQAHPSGYVLDDPDAFLRDLPTGSATLGDPAEPDAAAILLYTSGTTSEPKAAVLRHRHLLAYILNTLEFGIAAPEDAALIAVPPYHIAGLANLLTSLYTGRRVVYLAGFDARAWLETVRAEGITHALVVPTMLARIVDAVDGDDAGAPTLRNLAYGGARMPRPVLERALEVFPGAGFVNAYGLTETASSIAVLGPSDHRAALAAGDPKVRARLGSVGRALPGVEIQIRDGLVYVRGEQVSGEYGSSSALDAAGWFATRDRGRLDDEGYLFIEGRADDTIIRGGENIAPAEIEDVLLRHEGVTDAMVVGLPDEEWGQRLVAVVVGTAPAEELRTFVKERLRSSKTPDEVVFRDVLPRTETGKLLRRVILEELCQKQ